MSVYDFLKENDFAPFPRRHVQSFARQLFEIIACRFPRHFQFSLNIDLSMKSFTIYT